MPPSGHCCGTDPRPSRQPQRTSRSRRPLHQMQGEGPHLPIPLPSPAPKGGDPPFPIPLPTFLYNSLREGDVKEGGVRLVGRGRQKGERGGCKEKERTKCNGLAGLDVRGGGGLQSPWFKAATTAAAGPLACVSQEVCPPPHSLPALFPPSGLGASTRHAGGCSWRCTSNHFSRRSLRPNRRRWCCSRRSYGWLKCGGGVYGGGDGWNPS